MKYNSYYLVPYTIRILQQCFSRKIKNLQGILSLMFILSVFLQVLRPEQSALMFSIYKFGKVPERELCCLLTDSALLRHGTFSNLQSRNIVAHFSRNNKLWFFFHFNLGSPILTSQSHFMILRYLLSSLFPRLDLPTQTENILPVLREPSVKRERTTNNAKS